MQYKAGINQKKRKKVSLDSVLIIAVIRNDVTNSATKPIPVALPLLLPFIINMGAPCSILSKVISAFLFTRYGMPKSVTTPSIPLIGCLSINAAEEKPRNIPSQNIRFQKLSLFIRESIKPTFGWFGILSSNCLTLFLSLKGFVKSCISNTDYQFYILAVMLSGNRLVFKGIQRTTLLLSLLILWNTGVYATDINSVNGYWLKKYIAAVEQRNEIPRGLLSAIVSIESGFNPTAINIEGKTVIINDKSEAIKIINNAVKQGVTNIDIGIAQINYRWHKDNFKNIEEMINPTANIEYAAKLLSSLFKQHGTWHKAIRHYHSANPNHHKQYSRKVVIAWLGNSQLIK